MWVIHRVSDKFTTRSRQAHDKKSQPVDQLQFCLRHVHTFMFDFVVKLSRKSRELGSVTGDLANLRPEYHHVIFTPSDIIT
jgi:hypothetical protein